MISRQKKSGFTLIELLVVISIIALLSSIVLAALSTARGKANIAAGEAFDDHNYQAYGATAVGIWSLNETSSPWLDSSGNNNSLTPTGSVTSSSGIFGNAVQFNSNGYLTSANPVNLGTVWTVSAWVDIYSKGTNFPIFLSMATGSSGLYMALVGNFFDLSWTYGGGTQQIIQEPASDNRLFNTWYQVTATHDNNTTVLYVNGVAVAQDATHGSDSLSGILYLGGLAGDAGNSTFPTNGKMDNVRIYNQSLTMNDVQDLYAEGLATHIAYAR